MWVEAKQLSEDNLILGATKIKINEKLGLSPKKILSLYQFNTNTAEHYFCSTCGIYTHHRMRSNPDMYSINIACIDGVNPFEFRNVQTSDGINYSCDRK